MNDLAVRLPQLYEGALQRFLQLDDEDASWGAYQIGRESLQSGVPLLDLVQLHTAAVAGLSAGAAAIPGDGDGMEAATDFLLEVLAPYEMALQVYAGEVDSFLRRTEQERQATARLREALGRAERAVGHLEEERKRLAADLVDAEEKERKRIAAEVHDDSLQVLSALDMRIHAMVRIDEDPERQRRLQAAREMVRLASDRLRSLVFDLRPPDLERVGLDAVLRANLERLSAESEIDVELQDEMQSPPPSHVGMVLYRIAQEALANVRRHSQANGAVVRLAQVDGGWLLQVRDDGQGFDPMERAGESSRHFGLTVMRERAETVGGWVRVESLPGSGTLVEAWVPGDGSLRTGAVVEATAAVRGAP